MAKRIATRTRAARAPRPAKTKAARGTELVLITGMSGSGKGTVLKAFEDLGFYCVDNLPVELIPHFADLAKQSTEITRAALVVDVREGEKLERLPAIIRRLKQELKTTVLYLESSDEALLRRYSETRRPHPLSPQRGRKRAQETDLPVRQALEAERHRLRPITRIADIVVDTSRFNVHELRAFITQKFQESDQGDKNILISSVSFGYRHGVPEDADLVFDVRFLPNPHFNPKFRPLTGSDAKVARYIRSFPQTRQFISRISKLLVYLLPHYVKEGKSYLTIAFGCTGGQHRSVMIAEEVQKRLEKAGYRVKVVHRDCPR